MSERECAVGRLITRGDTLGGLDWKKPCPTPAGDQGLCLLNREGQVVHPGFDLCAPHAAVLLPAMEAAKQRRLRLN